MDNDPKISKTGYSITFRHREPSPQEMNEYLEQGIMVRVKRKYGVTIHRPERKKKKMTKSEKRELREKILKR